jgi:hypothetical protein
VLPPLVVPALPDDPATPDDITATATKFLPAGTVYVPEELKVWDNAYAGAGIIELLAEEAVDVPLAFVAVIVNVYAVLDAKAPVIVRGLEVPVVVKAIDGLLVAV